jgi:hypothetical protein
MNETAQRVDERATRVPVDHLAASIYGTITTLVAIGGLTISQKVERSLDPLEADSVILVGAISVSLAHGASHLVADLARRRAPLKARDVIAELRRVWPIVVAALPATVVLALSAAGLWSLDTALNEATALAVAALALVGVVTAGLAERSTAKRLAYVVSITMVGVAIAALEVAAHHIG